MATPGSLRPGPYGPTDWCLRGVDSDHDPDMGVFPELGDPVCGVPVKKHYSISGCTVEFCMENNIKSISLYNTCIHSHLNIRKPVELWKKHLATVYTAGNHVIARFLSGARFPPSAVIRKSQILTISLLMSNDYGVHSSGGWL